MPVWRNSRLAVPWSCNQEFLETRRFGIANGFRRNTNGTAKDNDLYSRTSSELSCVEINERLLTRKVRDIQRVTAVSSAPKSPVPGSGLSRSMSMLPTIYWTSPQRSTRPRTYDRKPVEPCLCDTTGAVNSAETPRAEKRNDTETPRAEANVDDSEK